MGNRDKILAELKEISKAVTNLGTETPYQVPAGYFEQLAADILNRVKDIEMQEGEFSSLLINLELKTPYEVPTGYFDTLPAIILNRIKATEASSPEEELEILSPFLRRLDKQAPFTLPKGYFEELPKEIVSGVNAIDFVNHELETLPPMMSAVKHTNVYKVPEGYFDNLPLLLLNKAKHHHKGKIIPLGFGKRAVRYAAAALLAGVMAVGAWLYFQEKSPVSNGAELAGINKISDDEIVNYLENNPVTLPEANTVASFDLGDVDVKELLADVPDEELQRYLEQNSVSKDMTTN